MQVPKDFVTAPYPNEMHSDPLLNLILYQYQAEAATFATEYNVPVPAGALRLDSTVDHWRLTSTDNSLVLRYYISGYGGGIKAVVATDATVDTTLDGGIKRLYLSPTIYMDVPLLYMGTTTTEITASASVGDSPTIPSASSSLPSVMCDGRRHPARGRPILPQHHCAALTRLFEHWVTDQAQFLDLRTPPCASDRDQASHLLLFDGGSRGNPGRGASGSVLLLRRGDADWEIIWYDVHWLSSPNTTNLGLDRAVEHARRTGLRRFDIVGDSRLVQQQVLGYFAVNGRLLALHASVVHHHLDHLDDQAVRGTESISGSQYMHTD